MEATLVRTRGPRVAGAPISWGVIEIPDWGYQMPADRLLREAASVGLTAMEAGPEDFLPRDPAEVSEVLARTRPRPRRGLRSRRSARAGGTPRRSSTSSSAGRSSSPRPGRTRWCWPRPPDRRLRGGRRAGRGGVEGALREPLRAEEICARHDLTAVLHSHFGTVIETDEQLWRFLEGCDTGLCLDTGHLVIGGSDPLEIAEKAADRVKHVHLKDVDREVARRLGAREIGFKEAARKGRSARWATAT